MKYLIRAAFLLSVLFSVSACFFNTSLVPTADDARESELIYDQLRQEYKLEKYDEISISVLPQTSMNKVVVYGAKDNLEQERMINLLEQIKANKGTKPMVVYFYEEEKFEVKVTNIGTVTQKSSDEELLLRRVVIGQK